MSKPELDVCAAVIRRGERVLLACRPPGSHLEGKWEFPGGKIGPGESVADCIRRELEEELRLVADPARILVAVRHEYPEKSIRLYCVACRIAEGSEPVPCEGQESRWVSLAELQSLDLAPADRTVAAWLVRNSGSC